jgi:putative chitobiose transport system substrate-binding protein
VKNFNRTTIANARGLRQLQCLVTCLLLTTLCTLRGCDEQPIREISFWTISLRPTFTDYIRERTAAFEREHPGTRVKWVDVPFSAIERKLLAAAAADRAPDVVNLSDMMFARFASAGAFADVGPLLTGEQLALYHSGALGVGTLSDQQLALPWYLTTQAMIVNRSLLSAGGLDLETVGRTWTDLMLQAERFHEQTGAFLFTQPLGTDSQLPMMMLSDGLVPFSLDSEGLLTADLSQPGVREFLAAWVDLYRSGVLPREAATAGFEHLIEVYQNQRVAVLNTGANFLGRVRDVSREVYEQSSVLPPLTGTLGAAHIAVMPLCVSASSSHPQLAADFAAFITSPESQLAFCRLAPILPSTPESLHDSFFQGPTQDEIEQGLETVGIGRATVTQALRTAAAFTPPLEAWPEMRARFNDRIKAALLDGADLDLTLNLIERDWQLAIDRMNTRRLQTGGRPAGAQTLAEIRMLGRAPLETTDLQGTVP